MYADAKLELIKKIAALPDSLPDETDDEHAQVLEVLRLLANINDIATAMLAHEERRRNWQVTVEAMEAARRGDLKTYGTVEDMFAALHADD
jgi:hypothetical protein